MTSIMFKELYDSAESGGVGSAVPAGAYDVAVTGARPLVASSLIFLTLRVMNGPLAGKEADVSLFFPNEESKRGARIYFVKKVGGFIAYPDVKAAFQSADSAPSKEAGFQLIADALAGKQVNATIGVRTDGEYAGTNELKETRPITANQFVAPQVQAPAVQAPPQAPPAPEFAVPAPQAAPQPVPTAPSADLPF